MKLLIQPDDGTTVLLDAINGAASSIEITIFRFDQTGIEQALKDAVKRGVAVRALIAHVNGNSAEALRELELRLLASGVIVARTDTNLARYHSKYVIIDHRQVFVLGFNFTRQDMERSRSFGIISKRRDIVQEATKLFECDTKRQPYKAGCPSLVVSPANARKLLTSFIRGAKKELIIYDPRLSDPEMLRLLADRVSGGVEVRIIGQVSHKASSDLKVRSLAKMRLHTRTIVRDGKALFVGSQSLRTLELDGRREVGIFCRDRSIVSSVIDVFERDWQASEDEPVLAIQPAAKVAKKVAKMITAEIPPVANLLEEVIKNGRGALDLPIAPQALQDSVVTAVKDVVKAAVQDALENSTGQNGVKHE